MTSVFERRGGCSRSNSTICVIMIFIAGMVLANDSLSQPKNTDIETVKNWIEPPPGFSMKTWTPEDASPVEKGIVRSGDWLGRTIARAYEIGELLNPDRLDRVLSLMRLSFSYPAVIIPIEDSNPRATMLLLCALKHECKDPNLLQRIVDAEVYIKEQLSKSQKDHFRRLRSTSFVSRSRSRARSRNGFTSARAFSQSRDSIRLLNCSRQSASVIRGPFHPVCANAAFRRSRFGTGHARSARYQTRS